MASFVIQTATKEGAEDECVDGWGAEGRPGGKYGGIYISNGNWDGAKEAAAVAGGES